jgi:chromosome segregation ATPase
LEQKVSGLVKDMEDIEREKEGSIHELKCTRIELEGCRRHVIEERERLEGELEREREQWKEREEELLTTNRVLDEELRDTQSRVKELEEKVEHRSTWLRIGFER